uniref:Cullin family profile domain-containing protein n=1 Tax=Globodera rostochiensis TaxID=31243 RepID=A0A914HW80_GLORO
MVFFHISISQSLTKRFHETILMLKQEIKTDIPIHVMGEELTDKSTLRLNTAFTCKRLLRLNTAFTCKRLASKLCCLFRQDRKYYTECAIVREMKARKVKAQRPRRRGHQTVAAEIYTRRGYELDERSKVLFIKKNIESPIDKYYLQITDHFLEAFSAIRIR